MRFALFMVFACLGSAVCCAPNETVLKSGGNEAQSSPAPQQASQPRYDSVEAEIENMRTADFNFILVLRRKDGGVMQSDDKAEIRTTLTGANRKSLVDSEKAVVIGSNARIPPELVKKLSDRFAVQDFSKPATENNRLNNASNANI
jgi:hypothetical protein